MAKVRFGTLELDTEAQELLNFFLSRVPGGAPPASPQS